MYCTFFTAFLGDVKGVADPLGNVKSGFEVKQSTAVLSSVHVHAQLVDMAAKVKGKWEGSGERGGRG